MGAASEELTPAETAGAALRLSESAYAASPALGDPRQSTNILNQSLERHVDGRNVIPPAKLVPDGPQNRKRGREPSSAETSTKRLKQLHDRAADRVRGAKMSRPTPMTQGGPRAIKQQGDNVSDPPDDSPVKNALPAVSKDKQTAHPRVKTAKGMNRKLTSVNGDIVDDLIEASENRGDMPPPDQAVRRKPGRPKANKITIEPSKAKPKEGMSKKHQLRSSTAILDLPDCSQKPGHRPTKLMKVQSTKADGTQEDEIAGIEGQKEHGGNADLREQQPSKVQSHAFEDKTGSLEPRSNLESEDAFYDAAGNANVDDGDQDPDENTEHNEGTSGSVLADFELFGQRDVWKKTIKAAEKVRTSRTGTRPSSAAVRRFIDRLEECRKIYEALGAKDEIHEHLSQHDPAHLNTLINKLKSEVHKLQRTKAGPKKKVKLLLNDIYVYGVPDLVILLGGAMAARTELYSAIDDCQALEEILKLQEITIALCTAAKQWRTTPKIGGISFVKEIERQISPYLRKIRIAFQNELDARYDKLRQVRRVEAREKRRLEAIEETQRSRQEQYEMIEERRRKTYADMLRNAKDMEMLLGSRRNTRLSISPISQRTFATADLWTKEQDRELVHQLRVLRYLPGNCLVLCHQVT